MYAVAPHLRNDNIFNNINYASMGKKINCLIAENDILGIDLVELLKLELNSIDNITVCDNGLEAINILTENEIDIVFCNAKTPLHNYNELLEKLDSHPLFIFVKSPLELTADLFGLNVVGVIEKPLKFDCLRKIILKAIECLEFRANIFPINKRIDNLVFPLNNFQTLKKEYFYYKEDSDIKRLENKEVLFLESMGNFSFIHTIRDRKHMTLVNLKHIEEQLPADQFIRVHRRYVINLSHINSITSDGNINLIRDHIIPLGNIYKAELMKIINKDLLMRH